MVPTRGMLLILGVCVRSRVWQRPAATGDGNDQKECYKRECSALSCCQTLEHRLFFARAEHQDRADDEVLELLRGGSPLGVDSSRWLGGRSDKKATLKDQDAPEFLCPWSMHCTTPFESQKCTPRSFDPETIHCASREIPTDST